MVNLGGVSEAVILRVERSTNFALTMLIVVPAQHEVTNKPLGLAQFDCYVYNVVELGDVATFGDADALFERLLGLCASARHAVEVSIDGLFFEDAREIIEIASFEPSKDETSRTDGAGELDHLYFLLPDASR